LCFLVRLPNSSRHQVRRVELHEELVAVSGNSLISQSLHRSSATSVTPASQGSPTKLPKINPLRDTLQSSREMPSHLTACSRPSRRPACGNDATHQPLLNRACPAFDLKNLSLTSPLRNSQSLSRLADTAFPYGIFSLGLKPETGPTSLQGSGGKNRNDRKRRTTF